MRITRFIPETALLAHTTPPDRDTLLAEMVQALCTGAQSKFPAQTAPGDLLAEVLQRERERTTATDQGVAFPHARIDGLRSACIAVATCEPALQYDGENRVNAVVLILTPLQAPVASLKVMARFSRFFMDPQNVHALAAAATPDEMHAVLDNDILRVDLPLYARDIMMPPRWSLPATSTLEEVARYMFRERVRTVPILDAGGTILGDITADDLLLYGIPDFFTNLRSVSFIAEYDPFEQYFTSHHVITAGEVLGPFHGIIPPKHTIMEVVFDLAVRRLPMLYVVDETGTWLGTVNRETVLDNVITY